MCLRWFITSCPQSHYLSQVIVKATAIYMDLAVFAAVMVVPGGAGLIIVVHEPSPTPGILITFCGDLVSGCIFDCPVMPKKEVRSIDERVSEPVQKYEQTAYPRMFDSAAVVRLQDIFPLYWHSEKSEYTGG